MASPNEKDKEETVITVDKAISKYNEERDKTGLVTLYNQHGKNINKLMEDLKASKPDEREKIQKQLNDVTSAQEALTAFMNKNNITIPLGGFGMSLSLFIFLLIFIILYLFYFNIFVILIYFY